MQFVKSETKCTRKAANILFVIKGPCPWSNSLVKFT